VLAWLGELLGRLIPDDLFDVDLSEDDYGALPTLDDLLEIALETWPEP
jgi:hypothetical protein